MYASSELILNQDGRVFHLHLKPEQLSDKVILVGDRARTDVIASYFDSIECEVQNREFRTITGMYRNKRISVLSTGIGCGNLDIVMNELDALVNIDLKKRVFSIILFSIALYEGSLFFFFMYTSKGTTSIKPPIIQANPSAKRSP